MWKNGNQILIVVDMQNDFVDGSLGTNEAQSIVDDVADKIYTYTGRNVVYTFDTHDNNYLNTNEGLTLPIPHCIAGTKGWDLTKKIADVKTKYSKSYMKNQFACMDLLTLPINDETKIEIVGLTTDICVISNALLLKAHFPNNEIIVDPACCAGTTPEKHRMALEVMKSCQITLAKPKEKAWYES